MNAQEQWWAGQAGNDYTQRNRVDWRKRIPFWSMMMVMTGARSVFELGTNAGWNLSAIKRACPDAVVSGIDINETAVLQARRAGLNVSYRSLEEVSENPAEFAFTAGVLIHVSPEHIQRAMENIVDASTDYVLAVEYASDQEEEIEYRGEKERLWRRPYGQMYQDMGLTLISAGDAGEGFDKCTFWLLRRA